jgi:predicted N-acetyltransferase YhbS
MRIRALRPDDDTSSFHSGNIDLDRFFQKYAALNQFENYIGTTYVAMDEAIVGFVTVAPGHVEFDEVKPLLSKNLPKDPLPILRLARMAVGKDRQRQGIGESLLRFVFELALHQSEKGGCAGVVVDAKPEAIEYYRRYGFQELALVAGESGARPRPTPMFLSIYEIKAALE